MFWDTRGPLIIFIFIKYKSTQKRNLFSSDRDSAGGSGPDISSMHHVGPSRDAGWHICRSQIHKTGCRKKGNLSLSRSRSLIFIVFNS